MNSIENEKLIASEKLTTKRCYDGEFLISLGIDTYYPFLELLYIAYKKNITTIPSEIGNLTNLQELGLHGNQLSTIPGKSVSPREYHEW